MQVGRAGLIVGSGRPAYWSMLRRYRGRHDGSSYSAPVVSVATHQHLEVQRCPAYLASSIPPPTNPTLHGNKDGPLINGLRNNQVPMCVS